MILADAGINLIILVIAGIVTLVRWLTTKDENSAPPAPGDAPPARNAGPTEDERMRRFLEALGVPADSHAPQTERRAASEQRAPRTAQPPPLQPQPRKMYPVPPIVDRPVRWPKPVVVPPPVPREAPAAESAPAPSLPVEELYLPELKTAAHVEYRSVASTVSATPDQKPSRPMLPLSVPGESDSGSPRVEELRELFRSPRELRAAIVLREILGPPRSLQSAGAFSTLP